MKSLAAIGVISVFTLAASPPAQAAPRSYDAGRIAYDRGFEDGFHEGEKDGKRGDRYGYWDEGRYRDGDHGYNRRFGPRHQYSNVYRRGFEEGYRRAFNAFSPYRSNGRGRYDDRRYDERYDRDERYDDRYYGDRYRR